MKEITFLRLVTKSDMSLIMAWRSQPQIYEGLYTQKKALTWDEHRQWWESRNNDWREFVIELRDSDMVLRPIGIVTVGQLDYWECEVGVAICDTSLWGRGYAKIALIEVIEWIKDYGKKYIRTTILDNNFRSRKLFTTLGFVRVGYARPNESLYRKVL